MTALLVVILLAVWTLAAVTAAIVLGAVIARRERQQPAGDSTAPSGSPTVAPRGADSRSAPASRTAAPPRTGGCRSAGIRPARRRRDPRS